jgi:tRNA (guanine-N7-)-methyltransferase
VVSFVRRSARMSRGQRRAYELHRDRWLVDPPRGETSTSISLDAGPLDLVGIFGRAAPLVVEVGPGVGDSLIPMATARPHHNVLAFEVFEPAVATLLGKIERARLDNVRVIFANAVEGLELLLPTASVAEVWTYFPDPWHKTRHHKRRLLSNGFADLVVSRLGPGGRWRLATDWPDYAAHIRAVLDAHPTLVNPHAGGWADRGDRPVTRFEQRAMDAGRQIFDLQYLRRDG